MNSVPIKAADKSEMSQCILATGCPPGGADALRIFHAAFAGFMTRSHKMRVLGAAALELSAGAALVVVPPSLLLPQAARSRERAAAPAMARCRLLILVLSRTGPLCMKGPG